MSYFYVVTRPSWFSSDLEVRDNGRVIGSGKMVKKWSYALSEAAIGGRLVQFGYNGWNTRNIFVRDASGTEIGAAQHLSWWRNDMSFTLNGKEYLWKQTDWWSTRFAWMSGDGEIMSFRLRWGMKHFADIECARKPDDQEMILLYCGLYLLELYQLNASSGIA